MTGKEKCRMLREIRARIAEENGLEIPADTCTHEGPCAGTCPACEAEVRQLEDRLARRASLGKRVALAGLCAGMVAITAGCSALEPFTAAQTTGAIVVPAGQSAVELEGEIAAPEAAEPEGDVSVPEPEELEGKLVAPGAGE